jgi:hypothetical protein
MKKADAVRLIRKTFEAPFAREEFIHFVRELLNSFDESKAHKWKTLKESFSEHIASWERIGVYEEDGKRIDLLIVHLEKETSLERARTMQRNFVAGYLRGDYGSDNEKNAALVAFVSADPADWRFSLVKLENVLEFTEKGVPKGMEKFTPARRWSFLVGEHENSHTAQSQLVPLIADDEHNPTLEDLENAFDIETVSDEFFDGYRQLFIETKLALDDVLLAEASLKSEFEAKQINSVDFAKKLLGQIVFLYYLQKKGWFGVPKGGVWGEGSKNFLRELFDGDGRHRSYQNFFNDILEPLFYQALRTDRSFQDHYDTHFQCKIPFLNGGLFDPIGDYDWVNSDLCLPNELFANEQEKNGDIGTGILDVFDRYNFTVREDEPFEKEVAIDPELLGKAYEKFNAIRPDNFDEYQEALSDGKKGSESKFNKKFGVYYTPREIVHYMCQQSLIQYLHTALNEKNSYQELGSSQTELFGNALTRGQLSMTEAQDLPEVTKAEIEDLILRGDRIKEHDARVVAKGRETPDYKFEIPDSIRLNAARVDEALATVKVCDPAVGSGAFPVGMMNEIVKARDVLKIYPQTSEVFKTSEVSTYHFKRACIENSLYGVDIDPGAVEIAKLRLWLSLIVDEEDPQNIKPLPNLDYKLMQGNSLLGLPEGALHINEILQKLEKRKEEYFDETHPTRKKEAREEINALFTQLVESARQFDPTLGVVNFDFRTHFSEIFHEKDGFDVIIANPPYGANLSDSDKGILKKRHALIVQRIPNTFLYFLGEAYKQTNPTGNVVFIMPNEFLFQIYMSKARAFFLKETRINFAINLGEDVFDAIVPTCVLGFSKEKKNSYDIPVSDLRNATLKELPQLLATDKFPNIAKKKILEAPNSIFSFDVEKSNLIHRLTEQFERFETFCDDIANGISTSCDEVYIIPEKLKNERNFEDQYSKECIRGGQFNRFFTPEHTNEYVLYVTKDFNPKVGRNIFAYLQENKDLLIKKSVEKRTGKRDWHILFRGRYENLFTKPKIIFRQTGDKIIASSDNQVGYYCIDSVNVGLVKPKYYSLINYFVAILNSKLQVFYYQEISQEKGRVLAQVKPTRIRNLPIAMGTEEQRQTITEIVEQAISNKNDNPKADTSTLEAKIDALVYELYGLTEEEIAVVEGRGD